MSAHTPAPAWHALDPLAVAEALGTDRLHGLADDEAARRLASDGSHELQPAAPVRRRAFRSFSASGSTAVRSSRSSR